MDADYSSPLGGMSTPRTRRLETGMSAPSEEADRNARPTKEEAGRSARPPRPCRHRFLRSLRFMVENANHRAQVLVVDDEREHAQVMCEALTRQGYQCDVTYNLPEALG